MLVELIGCTSAGKSTLTKTVAKRAQQQGIPFSTSYDFVLAHYGLGWVKPHAIRMALLNNLAIWRCVRSAGRHWGLLRFVFGVLHSMPSTVSRRERLKIARITLRNLGIHEIITQADTTDRVILADEGTLQVVHYLFVHLQTPPASDQLAAYLQRAPLPDLALYYRQSAALLIERTMRRGHKRIPQRTPEKVERFINHAVQVFEQVVAEPTIRRCTLIVNGPEQQLEGGELFASLPNAPAQSSVAHLMAKLLQGDAVQPKQCESLTN